MAIEIVDFPIDSMMIFHSYVNVYQRVNPLQKRCQSMKPWEQDNNLSEFELLGARSPRDVPMAPLDGLLCFGGLSYVESRRSIDTTDGDAAPRMCFGSVLLVWIPYEPAFILLSLIFNSGILWSSCTENLLGALIPEMGPKSSILMGSSIVNHPFGGTVPYLGIMKLDPHPSVDTVDRGCTVATTNGCVAPETLGFDLRFGGTPFTKVRKL